MGRFPSLIAVLVSVGALATATSAAAVTYSPTTASDHVPHACNASDCTLREAVIAANRHPGPDTIVLRAGKTYRRSHRATNEGAARDGDLDITDQLTIRSSGRRPATIDANRTERVLSVLGAGAKLKHLKLVRGNAGAGAEGGGIYFQSSATGQHLKVSNSTITRNSTQQYGGGIGGIGSGVATIRHSSLTGNYAQYAGGGISSGFPLVVSKSTVSGNRTSPSSGIGGGIYVSSGSAKISSSSISDNRSQRTGGIFNDAESPDRLGLTNVTVSGNRALETGGIGLGFNALVSLNATTVVRNIADSSSAGGITSDSAQIAVENSLIARNIAPVNSDCEGTIASGGHNLFGTSTGCLGYAMSDRTDLSNSRIGIGILGANGGPTKTVPLRASSDAVNHASSRAPNRDQRGRHRGNHPDIGAFERGAH
ncbi:hypothetical protein BH10ACT11_BH10ACT11_14840 [soil metagenome]